MITYDDLETSAVKWYFPSIDIVGSRVRIMLSTVTYILPLKCDPVNFAATRDPAGVARF